MGKEGRGAGVALDRTPVKIADACDLTPTAFIYIVLNIDIRFMQYGYMAHSHKSLMVTVYTYEQFSFFKPRKSVNLCYTFNIHVELRSCSEFKKSE